MKKWMNRDVALYPIDAELEENKQLCDKHFSAEQTEKWGKGL